jgi:hypothetical protein
MKITSYLVLMLLVSCSHHTVLGDRKLTVAEVPDFLRKYQSKEFKDVEIFEKRKPHLKFYEVKYYESKREISLSFAENGKFLEREEDTTLNSFSPEVQNSIIEYLNKEYAGYKVLEVEKRTNEDHKEFIDVEIRHASSPSGYWEISFTPSGEYVSREIEDYDSISTLN